jgi:HSP20 family molecular chaperone IbpA
VAHPHLACVTRQVQLGRLTRKQNLLATSAKRRATRKTRRSATTATAIMAKGHLGSQVLIMREDVLATGENMVAAAAVEAVTAQEGTKGLRDTTALLVDTMDLEAHTSVHPITAAQNDTVLGRGPPLGMPFFSNNFDPAALAAHFWERFTDEHPSTNKDNKEAGDFTPEADVFDTDAAFVVHIALPGAKKEDVGVNWDTEKSELSVAGVIYRPGDEAFLKTLALDERKVGPFERKIRLGTRANPAQIDADGISAKLEDGVLRVEVPKMDSGFVEVRKVDIE